MTTISSETINTVRRGRKPNPESEARRHARELIQLERERKLINSFYDKCEEGE